MTIPKLEQLLYVTEDAAPSNPVPTLSLSSSSKKLLANLQQMSEEGADSLEVLRYVYMDRRLPILGQGASRIAFALDSDYVLKVSKKGFEDLNRSEVENFQCTGPEFFAEVYAYDTNNFTWLVMERAEVNPRKVEKEIESWFDKPVDVQDMFVDLGFAELADNVIEDLDKKMPSAKRAKIEGWIRKLAGLLERCDIKSTDFHLENIGIRSDGSLVFIDYADYGKMTPGIFSESLEGSSVEELIKELHNTTTLAEINELVEKYSLEELGTGLTRKVFALDEARVLKVAKSDTYMYYSVNQREVKHSACPGADEFLARVLDHGKNYYWLIMERATIDRNYIKKFFKNLFVEESEFSTERLNLTFYFLSINVKRVVASLKPEYKGGKYETWLRKLAEVIDRCNIDSEDFHPGNMGIVERGGEKQIVFIDYAGL